MKFKQINRLTGWLVFACALLVYTITMEKAASFWDSGEFVAAAYKLQIVHPPGAPLWLMIGRLFSLALGENAALGMNFLSALSTSFAALFIFWSITILSKRLLADSTEEHLTKGKQIAILGSGIVGAFAFVFQESQWFNAVETEVYALSTCLTALVFWMALVWNEKRHEHGADRWLIAILFVIGLSIGVHLLNLLVIPAIALIVYFGQTKTIHLKGGLIAFGIGIAALLFIQYGVIIQFPELGANFELLFVNSLQLPFNSGMLFFLFLVFLIPSCILLFLEKHNPLFLYLSLGLIGLIAISPFFKSNGSLLKVILIGSLGVGIYLLKDRRSLLYKASLGFMFICIGYLSFLFVPIRSAANTPIDINNPDNVFSLLSYLNREQYGDRPLLNGPTYQAEPIGSKKTGHVYEKTDNRYEIIDEKITYDFDPADEMLFPRIWQFQDSRKKDYYPAWLGKEKDDPVNMLDNLKFFFTYQLDFMYWRYFMWNFAGRQNTVQAEGSGDYGNWMSGIPLADKYRVVQADVKPDSVANNPSQNLFFLIPFVFGLIGLILHFYYSKNDAIVLLSLFILTGVAIVVYLNQEPLQPRERDYAYVGSFMAFAIWIGLAVSGFYRAIQEFTFNDILKPATWLIYSILALFVMGFSSNNLSSFFGIVLVVFIIFGLVYTIGMLLKKSNDQTKASILFGLFACAPALMAFQGWDDHNRNDLQLALAVGKNYLNSAEENSILFTEGDNDTYPLWHAQEIKNVQPSIRIVNNSLLQAGWYINQVRQHNGMQPGLELTFSPEDYKAGKRDFIYHLGEDMYPNLSVRQLMQFIQSDDPRTTYQTSRGKVDILPTRLLTIDIDIEEQIKNGLISKEDANEIDSTLIIQLPKNSLKKDEYIILDIIQRNINKRPIYFTSENLPSLIGLSPYVRRIGSSFRLYPKLDPAYLIEEDKELYETAIDEDKTLEFMKTKMEWGNVESGVWLEETGQRQLMRVLNYTSEMMYSYAQDQEKEKAMETYGYIKKYIDQSSLPKDDMYILIRRLGILEALYLIDEKDEAFQVAQQSVLSALKQMIYVNTADMPITNQTRIMRSMPFLIDRIRQTATKNNHTELIDWMDNELGKFNSIPKIEEQEPEKDIIIQEEENDTVE